jgi:hypothetical protein
MGGHISVIRNTDGSNVRDLDSLQRSAPRLFASGCELVEADDGTLHDELVLKVDARLVQRDQRRCHCHGHFGHIRREFGVSVDLFRLVVADESDRGRLWHELREKKVV